MQRLQKEKFITRFSAEHNPAYSVGLDEPFRVETYDCYGGKITDPRQLRTEVDIPFINPATGPIYIEGLQKGDTLCVEIQDIQFNETGVMVLYPGMGALGEEVKKTDTRIVQVRDGKIWFNSRLQLPTRPMIGVIGVAPAEGAVLCETPGDHGGNMDTKWITIGSKLYLPVFHDGGLLALGDLHASMGDGELDGSGVEIGGLVTLCATKQAGNSPIRTPVVETSSTWYIIASGKSIEAAAKKGMKTAVERLAMFHHLSFNDAYRLLSATCGLEICQIVNPLVTVRIAVPKEVLPNPFS
ncbi:acetamidase/formamidase family protein [Heyndrickxia acidiproducens]|uniref:acetamidase/formamidase family protein n=1 Tax=Heyndrickxia acidiproducens TaxID=1121084 RepID=UPI0003770FF5|nr:acetamidase/formamidase family protein [Heyndrickxia acidiproducens]